MGSWDVACKATHFPIHCGDRCVCIALEEKKYYDIFEGNVAKTTFIRGEYNDYSTIKPDKNQFSLGYKEFIADRKDAFEHLNLMWMREDAFDALRNPLKNVNIYKYDSIKTNRSEFIKEISENIGEHLDKLNLDRASDEGSKWIYNNILYKIGEQFYLSKKFVDLMKKNKGDRADLWESIADIYYIKLHLYYCNIKFDPSYRASQCGAPDVNEHLMRITKNASESYKSKHLENYFG